MIICKKVTITYRKLSVDFIDKFCLFCCKNILIYKTKKLETICDKVTITYRKLSGVFVDEFILFLFYKNISV